MITDKNSVMKIKRNKAVFILMTLSSILLFSCKDTPPKKKPEGKKKETNSVLSSNVKYIDSIKDQNGLKIKWAKKRDWS